jgi:hypothetical protein
MAAFRQGIPFVKGGPTVLQRTAGTDMQSRLHAPVELWMVMEGLRGTLTISACGDPICIPGSRFAADAVSIRDGSGCYSDNLMSIPDAGPCKTNSKKIYRNGKAFSIRRKYDFAQNKKRGQPHGS